MNCRNEKGYCQKIFDKVNRKVYVDDKGCTKCDGNPKMPGEVKVAPVREAVKYYRVCRRICEKCLDCSMTGMLCKAGKLNEGFCCEKDKWPQPPDELKCSANTKSLGY